MHDASCYDRLDTCCVLEQPFEYEQLWDVALCGRQKIALNNGLKRTSQNLLIQAMKLLILKWTLEQDHGLPAQLLTQDSNGIRVLETVFSGTDLSGIDYGDFQEEGIAARSPHTMHGDKMVLEEQTVIVLKTLLRQRDIPPSDANIQVVVNACLL